MYVTTKRFFWFNFFCLMLASGWPGNLLADDLKVESAEGQAELTAERLDQFRAQGALLAPQLASQAKQAAFLSKRADGRL